MSALFDFTFQHSGFLIMTTFFVIFLLILYTYLVVKSDLLVTLNTFKNHNRIMNINENFYASNVWKTKTSSKRGSLKINNCTSHFTFITLNRMHFGINTNFKLNAHNIFIAPIIVKFNWSKIIVLHFMHIDLVKMDFIIK